MVESLIIEPEIKRQFHQLAEEMHRTESEVIHEALAGYLAAGHHYVEVLRQMIAAADRSKFANDEEVEAFFAERGE